MANFIFHCCPKCGNCGGDDCGFHPLDEIHLCPVCNTVTIGIQTDIDGSEFSKMNRENKLDVFKDSLREKYTLHSDQFDQDAWNRRIARDERIRKEPIEPMYKPNQPKCPTCGSTNVRRIGGVERAGSVALFGLFSGKIGKNYECLNCKARW